jgi:solute carrier family 35, member E1
MEDFFKDGSVDLVDKKGTLDHGPLVIEYVFNGIFHFLQNIMAFVLLSMLSPVSYSVASLIKRVWVIAVAVVWFRSSTTNVQLAGIGLTMFGLYLYDRNSMEDAAERRAKADHFRSKAPLLPVTEMQEMKANGHAAEPRPSINEKFEFPPKRERSADRRSEQRSWLPPGTKQESTWTPGDGRA